MRRSSLALLSLFLGAAGAVAVSGPAGAAGNPEFQRALEITTRMADSLQSYDLEGTLVISSNLPGQPEPMEIEVALKGASRWPDRLVSSQDSPLFRVNVGVNADQSWFHLGQNNTTYMGPARDLFRNRNAAMGASLEEEDLFNFYAGIGSFLLNESLEVDAATGAETLTVDGREVPCQVFQAPAGEGAGSGNPLDGDKTFWFDPETGLVMQARIVSTRVAQGMEMQQELIFRIDRFTLNGEVAESVFQYAPAAGETVVGSLDRVLNPDSMVGETAVDVTFTDLEGNPVKLSDYRGKVIFLDFWATWCGPCRMEMPHIQKLYEEMGGSGEVVFLGASSESPDVIRPFLEKNEYTFPIVTVTQEDAQKKYKVTSIPAGFVIDREGVIRAHMIGAQSEEQLRKALAKAGI